MKLRGKIILGIVFAVLVFNFSLGAPLVLIYTESATLFWLTFWFNFIATVILGLLASLSPKLNPEQKRPV